MTRRPFTQADRELWARVTQGAEPLHPKRRADGVPTPSAPKSEIAPQDRIRPFRIGSGARPQTAHYTPAPGPSDDLARAPLRMDAKTSRRMKSGKLRPEGKLDLHGMTLENAHPALVRFVLSGHADGKRLLLVVTGKGKAKPVDGPIPARLGVLRHQVPQWLRMPPLSTAILQVTEAHRSHGGSGAYYIYLARAR